MPDSHRRHPQRQRLVESWHLWVQQHARVLAIIRCAGFFLVLVLMGILLLQRRARGYGDAWVTSRSRMDVRLTAKTGETLLNCTSTFGPTQHLCFARNVLHRASATAAARRRSGSETEIALEIGSSHPASVRSLSAPGGGMTVEVAFVRNQSACEDGSQQLNQQPTIFMTSGAMGEHNTRSSFLLQLQQIYAALETFQLQQGPSRVVFVDDFDIDRLHPDIETTLGSTPVLLSDLPLCFTVTNAVMILAVSTQMLPADLPISVEEAQKVRPAMMAFTAWLLQRFNLETLHIAATQQSGDNKLTSSDRDAIRLLGEKAARTAYHAGAASKQCHSAGGKTAGILTIATKGLRRNEVKLLTSTGRACGLVAQTLDTKAVSFRQQLQVLAESTIYICTAMETAVLLAALPRQAVIVQIRRHPVGMPGEPYTSHVDGNFAVVLQRGMLIWNGKHQACITADKYEDGCKSAAVGIQKDAAAAIIAAAASVATHASFANLMRSPLVLDAT